MLAVAALFTLANAPKPLVVDDAAYYYYARHIAQHPTDPYGFEVFWEDLPTPALHLLAPVVFSYWWAGAIALFGDNPLLWKLWLFPFALILAHSLLALYRRLTPGLEIPLTWLTVFSPTLLPSFNLMLDVPALAFGLLCVERFARACERGDLRHALLAGVIGGVAMQTKYASVTLVGAMLAWGWSFDRRRLAAGAAVAAGTAFIAWECFLIARYGESHFLRALLYGQGSGSMHRGFELVSGLVAILGAVAPGLAILGQVAMRAPAWMVAASCGMALLIFAVLPALPALPVAGLVFSPEFGAQSSELFLFTALGGVVVATFALVFRALLREPDPARSATGSFLLAWLAIEVLGFALLNPFMAARRAMGIAVVLTAAAGQLAVRNGIGGGERLLRVAVGFSLALGLFFLTSDHLDAVARRRAAPRIAEELRALGAKPAEESVWVAGHWSYQYYTERLGMKQLIAGRTRLSRGDWVVVARGVARQRLPGIRSVSPPLVSFAVSNGWPWSTLPWGYAGPLPMRRQPRAQIQVSIHRMLADEALGPLPPAEP